MKAGTELVVLFDTEWHARIILAHVDASKYVILTPHGHIYMEDYEVGVEVDDLRLRPNDRSLP
eukprot:11838417-Karenia_brevis.AAC.1